MTARVGINGFGRIGRLATRIMIENDNVRVNGINCGYSIDYMMYQFKYDSVHGKFKGTVEKDGTDLIINGKRIKTSNERDPSKIPWNQMNVDYVTEATGAFLDATCAKGHIETGGAKKVIFTAPAKDDTPTFVMGVNHELYKSNMSYVSCASCTTNGLAPLVKAVHDAFTIEEGLMTAVHSVTASQKIVDGTSKKDWRGGRAGYINMIPSSTGAAKAIGLVIPSLKGKVNGMALRVPVINVSLVDLTCRVSKDVSFEDLCNEIKRRSETDLKGILGYTTEAVVSQDFITCPISSVFDKTGSMALNNRFFKLLAWYDNEYGYARRVVDLIEHMSKVDALTKRADSFRFEP